MIVRGAVLLDGAAAAVVSGVLVDGVHRRRARGEVVGVELLELVEEVTLVARAWRNTSAPGTAELPIRDDPEDVVDPLTTQQAADRLGVSDRWVRKLIADGRLSGSQPHGAWLIPAAEVERLASTRRTNKRTPQCQPLSKN